VRELHATVAPAQIDAAVRAAWKTDTFRRSHDEPGGYVRGVCDALAALPRLWCELDEPSIERSHFLAWMNVIPHRSEYDNPAISDLYYLHEYLHVISMRHAPDADRARWADKIWTNERDASLGSEVVVYFELPDLRAQTFGFEIWADRYLRDPAIVALHRDDPERFHRLFVTQRERAMTQPAAGDLNEALIASYHRLNVDWADVWADRYLDVETQLAAFSAMAADAPTAAVDQLAAWLLEEQGDGVCPFEDEAREFAAIVDRARAAASPA
jgi:hypothetical protein